MKTRFVSLDRQDRAESDYSEPDRYRNLVAIKPEQGLIARGAGLSYVSASFSEGGRSIGMKHFDRVLGFDPAGPWIEVEAGISLGALYQFLMPRGLRLPVQPGYPAISVGGCIAANVHGKNHGREGVFGRHVLELRLFHPRLGMITASASENAEVFTLTVGGLGLTGIIVSARLALVPNEGNEIEQSHHKVGSLEEAFRELPRIANGVDMAYAWLDLGTGRGAPGQGFVTTAQVRQGSPTQPKAITGRLDPDARPISLFGRATTPWINRVFRWQALGTPGSSRVTPPSFLFPAMGKESYFRFFGAQGFVEMQVLIPSAASDAYMAEFRRILDRHDVPIALTTLKLFAGGRRQLLHFDGEGFVFSIDVSPSAAALAMLTELDEINTAAGGITCVIKDSRLSGAIARLQYPELESFRERLHAYDRDRLFTSNLSRRLGL